MLNACECVYVECSRSRSETKLSLDIQNTWTFCFHGLERDFNRLKPTNLAEHPEEEFISFRSHWRRLVSILCNGFDKQLSGPVGSGVLGVWGPLGFVFCVLAGVVGLCLKLQKIKAPGSLFQRGKDLRKKIKRLIAFLLTSKGTHLLTNTVNKGYTCTERRSDGKKRNGPLSCCPLLHLFRV